MNYNKRVDKNQQEIVAEFRRLGFSVYITSHVGAGFPDLMSGKNGKTILVEIKSSESCQQYFGCSKISKYDKLSYLVLRFFCKRKKHERL